MKDPAVLFYTQDFLTGTMLMTPAQRGNYITLLCLQHQKGRLSERDMLKICGEFDEDIWEKFERDENGLFYNVRMENEGEKRRNYTNSRRKNLKKDSHMNAHMENENENINEDVIVNKELIVCFEIFRNEYPGTKRGHGVELENLKKKHKDWKDVIPLLSDALNYQKNAREMKAAAGGFVPEWKNLQTWINQRCWEEEIETNNLSHGKAGKTGGATDEAVARIIAREFGSDATD